MLEYRPVAKDYLCRMYHLGFVDAMEMAAKRARVTRPRRLALKLLGSTRMLPITSQIHHISYFRVLRFYISLRILRILKSL